MTRTERAHGTRNVWFMNWVISYGHSENKVWGPVLGLTVNSFLLFGHRLFHWCWLDVSIGICHRSNAAWVIQWHPVLLWWKELKFCGLLPSSLVWNAQLLASQPRRESVFRLLCLVWMWLCLLLAVKPWQITQFASVSILSVESKTQTY